MTAYSMNEQAAHGEPGFPFVTMPSWHALAADTRILAKAVAVMYVPIIRGVAQRQAWEAYAVQNRQQALTLFVTETNQKTGRRCPVQCHDTHVYSRANGNDGSVVAF